MKTYISYLMLLVALLSGSACNKWFDVTSSSEIRADEHYNTVVGFQQTLVGCYMAMGNEHLYGRNLSWYALEVMAHQYRGTTYNQTKMLYEHNYKAPELTLTVNTIWSKLYNIVANINDGLLHLEAKKEQLSPIDYAVLKGEFLALRAYIHFDLLRLYGYGNWAEHSAELLERPTIPYVKTLNKQVTRQSTGSEIYTYLKSDLNEAALLLKQYDPIVAEKPIEYYADVNVDGFYRYRNLHLNYYAVKALEARVHQWFAIDATAALTAAREVIDFAERGGFQSSELFATINLLKPQYVSTSNASLTVEALFALDVPNMDKLTASYFVTDYTGDNYTALSVPKVRVEEIFETYNTDIRRAKLMQEAVNSGDNSYVSLKYVQGNLGSTGKNRVNMIRLSEMYYIAAEAALAPDILDLPAAYQYLNTIRSLRGIYEELKPDLGVNDLLHEIDKEYLKEYLAEGVVFFLYKRRGAITIPMREEPMSEAQYVLPFPDLEIRSGRVQPIKN